MSFNNSRGQGTSFVTEKEVLEPEASCEDNFVKRSQSGRKIEENGLTISLRKCQSADALLKKTKKRKIRRLRTQRLKVPQVPDKIVDLVNILQHENFLKAVNKFFKPKTNKQTRKESQSKKPSATEKPTCQPAVPCPTDFKDNTL